jgi:hypothetical protein
MEKLKMYPSFDEVFTTKELVGVFYPLCSLGKNLHFVSSNGLWMDERYETEDNTKKYTKFEIENSKYNFKGDIRLYKGYEFAKKIFSALENDFETNGKDYLNKKMKTELYIKRIKKSITSQGKGDIDLEYYLQAYYEFNINKLNYILNGKFGCFSQLMEGFESGNESPIIYPKGHPEIETMDTEEFQEYVNIEGYSEIGVVIGYEFFTDGNDSVLFFNKNENKVITFNHYS